MSGSIILKFLTLLKRLFGLGFGFGAVGESFLGMVGSGAGDGIGVTVEGVGGFVGGTGAVIGLGVGAGAGVVVGVDTG